MGVTENIKTLVMANLRVKANREWGLMIGDIWG